MARSALLLDLVRAGARGDRAVFQKSLEAIVSDERAKQHHVLADRLAAHLQIGGATNGSSTEPAPLRNVPTTPELFFEMLPERRLDDLVLPEIVRNLSRELIEEHNRADLLRAHNLEPRHTVLVSGPPGNGKTSFAEALATELALPLLLVRYEAVIGSFLGETALRLSRLFDQVRTRQCVVFFDEFDVVGKERGDVHETGEIKRVVSSLLLQVDFLPSHVVAVAATNHPELLDRAAWRRFQVRLDLPAPTPALAEEWFCRFQRQLGVDLGLAPATLAKRFDGTSFAEMEQFALEVQREHVLRLPDGDVPAIVAGRLKHWDSRSGPRAGKRGRNP